MPARNAGPYRSTHSDWRTALPQAGARRIALHVAPAAELALRNGHPWLFDRAIRRQSHSGQAGDLAVVFDRRNRFLAIGLYDPASPIRVRILHQGTPVTIDRAWFEAKLEQARARRRGIVSADTTGYRLVHGENDGLPGLVVDCYADTLVVKLYTGAWLPHLPTIVACLDNCLSSPRLVLRLSRHLQQRWTAHAALHDGMVLCGSPLDQPLIFLENGLRFEVDPLRGQKTGFFLDQRDNRRRVEMLARDRSVLNVFAYSGGFSLYAARGGARSVTSLDVSAPALAAAQRNFSYNCGDPHVAAAKHQILVADAFAALAELARQNAAFDLVVIDPPAFAKERAEIARARAAYVKLTRLGLALVRPAGILVMASCSSRIDAESFFDTVHQSARQAGRPLVEIERTGHPPDHPISFAEGAYLKCLFATAP